jgi:hypothetical protein
MSVHPAQVVCEILAPNAALAETLGRIVGACARDAGQPVTLSARPADGHDAVITLRLPVELASTQHPVWCLACQLACFCPQARVSVLILGENAFPGQADSRSA